MATSSPSAFSTTVTDVTPMAPRPGLSPRRLHQPSDQAETATLETQGLDQAIGRSRGGLSTQIHVRDGANGLRVRLALSAGQAADSDVVADRGDHYANLRRCIQAAGSRAYIPTTPQKRTQISITPDLYRQRNLIEPCFKRPSTSAASPRASTNSRATTSAPSPSPPSGCGHGLRPEPTSRWRAQAMPERGQQTLNDGFEKGTHIEPATHKHLLCH